MAKESVKQQRLEIPMFDGINTLVGSNISKKQDLSYSINARSKKIGIIEKREGITTTGTGLSVTSNYGLFYFDNETSSNTGLYRISNPDEGADMNIYYLNTSDEWVVLTDDGAGLTTGPATTTIANDNLYIASGGSNANRYITNDGETVVTSSSVTGNLYNSPDASKINFYKDRLYVANYLSNSTSYKTSIMMSSIPVGIVSLIDGDQSFSDFGDSTTEFDITTSGDNAIYTYTGNGTDPLITKNINVGDIIDIDGDNFDSDNNGTFTVTSVYSDTFEIENDSAVEESGKTIGSGSISSPMVKLTDTKYIYGTDLLDVYRGEKKIAVITVTSKEETYVSATVAFEDDYSTLNSSDEVWVAGTFGGERVFRWAGNPSSGVNVKEYDTFKLTGSQDDEITMLANVSDYMFIGSANNLSIWNGASLKSLELGIGCVSDRGYGLILGSLWFVHYTGIYSTGGGIPKLMSSKVEDYINGATKSGLNHSAVGKKKFSVFFAIGDVTLYNDDGSMKKELSDVCLEFDIRQDNWFVHTGVSANQFATYLEENDTDRLEYTSKDTDYEVKEFLSGVLDNDKEIDFRMDTDNITLARNFENISYPTDIVIETERGSGSQVFVSMDNKPFYQVKGDVFKGCNILKLNAKNDDGDIPRCRRIRISIRDFTKNLCKISRIAIRYSSTLEEEIYKKDE